MKRAAVIGLGDISVVHLEAICSNPQIELCAVCDIDPSRKPDMPVPFYTDYREMADREKPDCVHLCLPHYQHYPAAREMAARGIHIFCEKPLALDLRQSGEFLQLEEDNPHLHIGICLQNRVNGSTEMLKRIIDSGEYGKVTGTRGTVLWRRTAQYYESKPWRGRWSTAGGGCMINQAVHTLDLLYYLGGPVRSVKALTGQLLSLGIQVEDTAAARLNYAGGAEGLFIATNANYTNNPVEIAICMEKGEFLIRGSSLYQMENGGRQTEILQDKQRQGGKFYYGNSHGKLISQFYRALEEDSGDYIHAADAFMSMRLIEAIQNSGRFGTEINI